MREGRANSEITFLPRGRQVQEMMFGSLFLHIAECADVALRAAGKTKRDVVAMIGLHA